MTVEKVIEFINISQMLLSEFIDDDYPKYDKCCLGLLKKYKSFLDNQKLKLNELKSYNTISQFHQLIDIYTQIDE